MERKITIEESVIYKEDYQMRMLQANELDGILTVRGRGIDGCSYYDYDVSGKISMKAMYERGKIESKDIKAFLGQLRTTMKEVERYLLNKHCILLKPEYIFYEDGKYYFCYYPLAEGDMWEEFHILTEYFVKQADYEDKECVKIVFLLHKETMEENYSMEKIIEECMKPEQPPAEVKEEDTVYDTREHDWIAEQEMGSSILKETENLWTPMKRFLEKHRKPKWGDWDGLYIEEEELM